MMEKGHAQMDVTRLRAIPNADIYIHLEGCFDTARGAYVTRV